MIIRSFEAQDTEAVVALWERCGLTRPWNDPRRDIECKRAVDPELFLVGELDGGIVATAMGGYEGHRGWVNYLAVAPERRGGGLGRAIMERVEAMLRERGCPKINVQIRNGNHEVIEFYRQLGFEVDDVVSMGKRLEQD